MLRISRCIGALLIGSVCSAPGLAQTAPRGSEVVSCPRGGLSVYYARGEASPSEQAVLLIARIGEEASRCQPDGIDLVTEIDGDRDGEGAISLAMARLNNVAEKLVAGGYPVDRIRLAAQSSLDKDLRPPMGVITVYFRQTGAEAGEASARASAKPSRLALGDV
jgi:hypothetical protein